MIEEIDPLGRYRTFELTDDPVDCMTCLVVEAGR